LSRLRNKIKGWSINVEASNKKIKKDLLLEFDILDVFSEKNQLSPAEKNRLQEIKGQLKCIWQQEETKSWQRSRKRHI
jgi:hypothetical protein